MPWWPCTLSIRPCELSAVVRSKELKFVARFTVEGHFLGIGIRRATSMEITVNVG